MITHKKLLYLFITATTTTLLPYDFIIVGGRLNGALWLETSQFNEASRLPQGDNLNSI